ncbi:MAG: alpha/beta fold hydrolase [Reyranella sp.]|jgi:pimeloyl-ACP methyl ester carboxylesterase|uniref:alpha/beta fold hydrolase n=1 Tax=Reyranella sp. TaxID=1929291 RepID=UPI0025E2607C|nr:alpha/beta hydrolase [Reyranella sp.]MBR2815054.1 alpha/beta fold hydrolase [Reyranella sp.]
MLKHVLLLAASLLAPAAALAQSKMAEAQGAKPAGQYAEIGGLKLYYQQHGPTQPKEAQKDTKTRPLLVLHGGFMTIEAMGPILPALAAGRPVIAVDLEGHGRTRDLDRPLSLDQMAADVAALVKKLGLEKVDVLGFSMGGGVALRIAAAEPALVAKLVVISSHHKIEAYYPSIRAMWPGMTVQGFTGTPMEKAYLETAPDPAHWPVFVEKMKAMMLGSADWPDAKVQAIKAPTLLIAGDADLFRPESMVDLFRLLGGARPDGGMAGVPASQLAILPGATHFNILYRTDLLLPIVVPFLDS